MVLFDSLSTSGQGTRVEGVGVSLCCFKQKTAYEMRISDWSSDVCSSDLFVPPHQRALGYVFQEASLCAQLSVQANLAFGLKRIAPAQRRVDTIGRASCRESVCQYV